MSGHKSWSEISATLRADPERRVRIEQRGQAIEIELTISQLREARGATQENAGLLSVGAMACPRPPVGVKMRKGERARTGHRPYGIPCTDTGANFFRTQKVLTKIQVYSILQAFQENASLPR